MISVEKIICPECGEDTVRMMDDVDGEIYVCPECGEEIHRSNQLHFTAEKNMIFMQSIYKVGTVLYQT